jgi:hypothetical protein
MRQSSQIWNKTLHASFLSWGFTCAECEWCVYSQCTSSGSTIVGIHVDNMLATSSNDAEVSHFRSELESAWQITALGEPKLIVGIALRWDRAMCSVYLSQTALINKIITTHQQTDASPVSTPIIHGTQLLPPDLQTPLDEGEQQCLDTLPYRSLVGSLMYVASGTRPDIMFAVSKLSRFLNCFREIHWQAAVCVVRYLKGTKDLALRLGGTSVVPTPLGYSDSDYTNNPGPEGRRSIGGYCFMLGSGIVSWSSKKQQVVSDSTCAAEYIAVSEAGKELIWI